MLLFQNIILMSSFQEVATHFRPVFFWAATLGAKLTVVLAIWAWQNVDM